jgi:hypothetical protein
MDSSSASSKALVPTGATTIAGVKVLPIRLPALPPALEAVVLGCVHSLVAAPVLYAVATPALEIMSRYWIALVNTWGYHLARLFTEVPRWRWWRHDAGLAYSSLRLLVLGAVLVAGVHVLTLPLQAGARRRARTERGTLPLYSLAGGAGIAWLVWWSGLAQMLHYRADLSLPAVALVGLVAASRVAHAGYRAHARVSEVGELARELAVGAVMLVALLATCVLAVAAPLLMSQYVVAVGAPLGLVAGLVGLTALTLNPVRNLYLCTRRSRLELKASEPAGGALPEST